LRCIAGRRDDAANELMRVSMTWDRKRARRCAVPPEKVLAREIHCSGASNSLFHQKDSLFRKEQGIFRRLFKMLCDFAAASGKTAPNKPSLPKFPVNFPVLRESAVTDRP
jgi:hypothetical protein